MLYRQVNIVAQEHFDCLMDSGLYKDLVEKHLLVSHKEVKPINSPQGQPAYKVIQPEIIDFFSYPYEWTFHQLRSAALTTLRIARIALDHGMILKDASAYNIQFYQGHWQLIDTLSFEIYKEGEPWVAYRQFCQHFLAPLTLMAYKDPKMGLLSRLFIDGIPLDLAASLLPFRSKLNLGLLTHIHLHAKSQKRFADNERSINEDRREFSQKSLSNLFESLRNSVKRLSMPVPKTEWAQYYEDTNYSGTAFEEKKGIVSEYIERVSPSSVWDLGANTGEFSRLASEKGIFTVAFDVDPGAVSKNYFRVRKEHEGKLLPLLMDLTNPSPGLGWGHQERQSLIDRGPVDLVLALALVHHLAISNNVPLQKVSRFLKQICKYLIIEFVPKSDSQVQRLLRSRKDIFENYTLEGFEEAFGYDYDIIQKRSINGSDRTLYLMKANEL
jgi:hypothetical protein